MMTRLPTRAARLNSQRLQATNIAQEKAGTRNMLMPAVRAVATVLIVIVGLAWAAKRRTDSLSGGERQKVAIARALHQRAPLLLADEPTASLDAKAAAEIAALMSAVVVDAGAAMLCVVHDLDLVPNLAQRVLVLRQGRLVVDMPVTPSTPRELRPLLQ